MQGIFLIVTKHWYNVSMEQDFDKKHWSNPCPKYDCRKDKCKCGLRYASIPAVLGDDSPESTVAPKNGAYCNTVVKYEANGHVYVYTSEGIPTLVTEDCECPEVLPNLVVRLPNGMTTYTNNDVPIPIPDVIEAFNRGQSVFLVNDALPESVYVVTAANMDDGIYSMRADQTGINPRISDGHWHISGDGDNVWDSVTFINDATPLKYIPNIYNKTWSDFTYSTPLLDQSRRTYYPASSDMTFNNTQENLSVAELWEKLASSAWSGNPVILEVPLQEISTRATNVVDNGFIAENPCLTITVSLGPDNYFECETSEYMINGWAAECTPITFRGKESYMAGIVRVVENGNTHYAFVVSLTEVEDQYE